MPQTVFDEEGHVLLWDADPDCTHVMDPWNYSGQKCIKCRGWFCF